MKKQPIHLWLITVAVISCSKKDNTVTPVPTEEKKWIVTTVAGNGIAAFKDGAASEAEFRAPQDVTVTTDGCIYVADAINHRIRKIANDVVTSFAGSGAEDTTSGVGTAAAFSFPVQIISDVNGNLYTSDIEDLRIRKISQSSLVTVVAGSGERGFLDGNAATSKFGQTLGLAQDSQGNIYVADNENKRIRKIGINGEVSTITGDGRDAYVDGDVHTAEFFSPTGIVVDKYGNLYVADYNRIREITPNGYVSTIAGTAAVGYKDGPAYAAQFTFINDIAIDASGNLYVTDDNRIRKITPQGAVSTIAGTVAGFSDGDGASAKFNNPVGLGIDSNGNIYVADDHNNRIRKISYK